MTPGRVLGVRPLAVVPRVLAAILAVGAGIVAWRVGGGADPRAAPPRPEPATSSSAQSPSSPPGARPSDGYEVSARLVDLAQTARFDMPHAEAAKHVMKAHGRQRKPPFSPVTGEASRFVTSVALRTSSSETQPATAGKEGKAWTPDARVWNMNEGSFDEREALVSPAPGSIAFRVNVPRGAKLTFAEGTVSATDDATVFIVSVRDGEGTIHEAYRHALAPSLARKWTEASVDLSRWAGHDVELRLSTEAAKSTERPVADRAGKPPAGGARHRDAGAPAPDADTGAATEKVQGARPRDAGAPAPSTGGRPAMDAGVVREDALAIPIALWGNPTLLARTTPRVAYNVLWIVVDALRPDVIASFHDDAEDAAKHAAPLPPLEALLPKVPGVTPEIDDLAKRGARFTRAYSAGSWTRPGTLAMLAGARSSELGIDTTEWMIAPEQASRFYGSNPPLLSLSLRDRAVTTLAFVNNDFMLGYAPVGIGMGFERVDDHRYRTRDTLEITEDATRWIKDNKDTRFFAFVHYNSPHEPYEPPPKHVEKIPPHPAGPNDKLARLYMAEAAKDDEAIGVLMRTLDETGLRERTIVVVTADHGETLSSAHAGTSSLDKTPIRQHRADGNFEETTKVPILIVAPGLVPPNTEVKTRVRTIDIAPTVLDLLGLEAHARMSGKSLVPLTKGQHETEERVVVSEGRGSKAIMHGRWRLIVREGGRQKERARVVAVADKKRDAEVELYDLTDDPGERRDLAPKKPELVAEMKARLDAALRGVPVAGGDPTPSSAGARSRAVAAKPALHLRFAGGAQPRRVSGTLTIGDAKTKPKTYDVQPVQLGRDAFRLDSAGRLDLALRTSPTAPVGFDIVVDPPSTPVSWELWLDDKPWPEEGFFGGRFGLLTPVLRKGVTTDEARHAAEASLLPMIDARRDVGLFVTRDRGGEPADGSSRESNEGAEEMARLLRERGYTRGAIPTNK